MSILDRTQPLPTVASRNRLRGWLPYLAAAAIGGLMHFLPLGSLRTLPVLLLLLPAVYLALLVHELGHVVAGSWVGFELRSLSVGAVFLTREASRWRIRWITRQLLSGGHARMVPRSLDRLVERYRRFALGGPVASAAFLVLAALWLAISPGGAGAQTLFLAGVMFVALSCLPFTWRGSPSDGKQLLLLMRRGPAADHLAAMLYLLALDTQRVSPRDWPQPLVDTVSTPPPDSPFLQAAVAIRYVAALDRGDPEGIGDAIERALAISADLRPEVRQAFYLAASCFQGQWRRDVTRAESWLNEARRVKGPLPQEGWDGQALGIIALANGEPALARAHLTRYLAMLERQPFSGLIDRERARTAQLLSNLPTASGFSVAQSEPV
jgi:hypothetical protein